MVCAKGFEARVSDHQLLKNLRRLLERGRALELEILVHIGEIDARRLYLEQACPSMFHYCVHVLHLAEGVAYKRIAVARAARRCPELLAALENGELHLTAASLLVPHLSRECAAQWLAAARHKSTREVKRWIADRRPQPDVTSCVRKLPARRSSALARQSAVANEPAVAGVGLRLDAASANAAPRVASPVAPAPSPDRISTVPTPPAASAAGVEKSKARCEPLGSDRYCVRFTIDAAVHEELQELRALLRHQIPDGDVAKIIARAVHALLEQARRRKRGAGSAARPTEQPATANSGSSDTTGTTTRAEPDRAAPAITRAELPSKRPSRHIPVAVRRVVWERDGGRCSYVSREGRRCGTREFLEFHHEVPWARCREHRARNIRLRCRAHNRHAAEADFGAEHMAACRKRRGAFAVDGNSNENEGCARRAAAPEPQPQPQLDSNLAGKGIPKNAVEAHARVDFGQ